MRTYLINFESLSWECPAPGIRYKAHIQNDRKIRLVEFSEDLDEKDWCTKGHAGYVLEGCFSIDFNGNLVEFSAGDGIFIPPGEDNRHKAKVKRGEKVLLIFFEEMSGQTE